MYCKSVMIWTLKGVCWTEYWLDASIVVCCMWIASAVLSIMVGLACDDPPHIVFWGWWLFGSWILLQSLVIWKLSYAAEPEWMKQNYLQYRGVQWSEDLRYNYDNSNVSCCKHSDMQDVVWHCCISFAWPLLMPELIWIPSYLYFSIQLLYGSGFLSMVASSTQRYGYRF
jgi:hypothetical protein